MAPSSECQTSLLNRLATSFEPSIETSFKPSSCSPSCTAAGCHLACFRLAKLGSKGGAAELKHHGSEGRIGPAARSSSAKRQFLNRLETSFKPSMCSPSCTAGCHLACFRPAQLGSKGGAAELKHHGSEGRIGPAARSSSAKRQFLNRLETSFKPSMCSPSCTAGCHLACFRPAQLRPRAVPQS